MFFGRYLIDTHWGPDEFDPLTEAQLGTPGGFMDFREIVATVDIEDFSSVYADIRDIFSPSSGRVFFL